MGGASAAGGAALVWLYADSRLDTLKLEREYIARSLELSGSDDRILEYSLANIDHKIAQWSRYKKNAARAAFGLSGAALAGGALKYVGKKRKWWSSDAVPQPDTRGNKPPHTPSITPAPNPDPQPDPEPDTPPAPAPRPSPPATPIIPVSPVESIKTGKLGDTLKTLKRLVAGKDRNVDDITFNRQWRKAGLNDILIPLEGREVKSKADGGCWFHTLARHLPPEFLLANGISPNDDGNTQLREKIVELIIQQAKADPGGIVASVIDAAGYDSLDKYKKMSNLSTWADDLEVSQSVLCPASTCGLA